MSLSTTSSLQADMTSTSGKVTNQEGTSGSPARSSRRNRPHNDLLRNYYGMKDPGSSTAVSADPLDPDASCFQVDSAFHNLLQTKSLGQLIREESSLLTEIRELDGERQSLVYNHHHELVSASETMKRMKDRADALIPNLDSLQSALHQISTTTHSLQPPREYAMNDTNDTLSLVGPVAELPQRLRDSIALDNEHGLDKAQSLWGSMESVLAAWDEAGIAGAKGIAQECRLVLREAQQDT